MEELRRKKNRKAKKVNIQLTNFAVFLEKISISPLHSVSIKNETDLKTETIFVHGFFADFKSGIGLIRNGRGAFHLCDSKIIRYQIFEFA